MKIKIITIVTALACTIIVNAQSFMTNTVAVCKVDDISLDFIVNTMTAISRAYNVRICTESQHGNKSLKLPNKDMVFTNATFENVFGTFMQATTGMTWRYENETDSIYVYPITNAISMKHYENISWQKTTASDLFDVYDIFGLGTNGIYAMEFDSANGATYQKVSLDFENAYMWQILDALETQLMFASPWSIWENEPNNEHRYYVVYFPRFHENWWTNRVEYQNQ